MQSLEQVLIYLPNDTSLPLFEGSIYQAQVIDQGPDWLLVQPVTDQNGQEVTDREPTLISAEFRLTLRQPSRPFLRYFYYSSSDGQVTATNFVDQFRMTRPLTSTSRSAIGSGIYGLYLLTPQEVLKMTDDNKQELIPVPVEYPFFLHDKEHGVSLSLASYISNVFLDQLIEQLLTQDKATDQQIQQLVLGQDITYLVRLWNFVFLRTEEELIDREWLVDALTSYLVGYFSGNSIPESITNHSLQVLPINHILGRLGYDGVIASDYYNNGWDRGCVSYRYELANSFFSGVARD